MELVIDANILFSALIKKSVTAELIFNENLKLYAPDFFIEEFIKYQELIIKKTHRTEGEFIQILHCLQEVITSIPEEEFSEHLEEAEKISPDKKDISYLALAMKLKCAVWSNDKVLKTKQKVITVYSTEDLVFC
ncbi:hypothetical protein J4457_03705 [Candidatus Woesearchaeota archaeon]|nr:hypothetical protein [Candidatus Woesearchaeota archaeon]